MSVKIGSARIDENGNITGGKPGDQTGKEVSTQAYYDHSKGWYVLRSHSEAVAETIATTMEAACKNENIGYNQASRNSLYSVVKVLGFDCSKLIAKANTDCSALVRVCLAAAGIMVDDFTTGTEVSRIMATGKFARFTDDAHTKGGKKLIRGDILVTKTKGHTAVVLTDGADGSKERAEFYGKLPDEVSNAVTIKNGTWRVRETASTAASTVGIVHGGDQLERLEIAGWVPVKISGKVGFISQKAIENQ